LDNTEWTTELQKIDTSALTDTTIRAYGTLEAFAIGHPEIRDRFTYESQSGTGSFFQPDGTLDWNAIVENQGAFENQVAELGLNFEANYQSGLHDKNITHTTIPHPADPSTPPNP
jgi:hypothetical protein